MKKTKIICTMGPVSYTHLDVYKRQVQQTAWLHSLKYYAMNSALNAA